MKVVLLNPPAPLRVLRDYYCTSVAKSSYYYHPIDLVYMSGTLGTKHEVCLVDSIAEGLSARETEAAIKRHMPDAIVALVASPTLGNDFQFLRVVKQLFPHCRIVVTGDVVRELGARLFTEYDFVDAAVMDFSTDAVLAAVDGKQSEAFDNVIIHYEHEVIAGEEKHTKGEFSIERPRWELFISNRYRFPFSLRTPFASVLSDFGCPYECTFCPISTLGFKLRPVSDVIDELAYLKRLGVKELHFRDQTFGVYKRRTFELCEAMRELGFTWSCFTRVDVITEELLRRAAMAGCHTVIFGIETADEQLLLKYRKNMKGASVLAALELCNAIGLNSVGTFMLGLPGETYQEALRTIAYACSLPLDFASFNMAVPRLGSTFRKRAVDDGIVRAEVLELRAETLPEAYVGSVVNQTQKVIEMANRRFYRRIPYLLRRARRCRSVWSVWNQVRIGWQLMR